MNDQTNVYSAAQLVRRTRSDSGAQVLQASCRQAGKADGVERVGTWNPKVDLRVLMRQPRYVVNTAFSKIVQIRPAAGKQLHLELQSGRIATIMCITICLILGSSDYCTSYATSLS